MLYFKTRAIFRNLDHCETLIEKIKINPNDLLSILNSVEASIQFTMEYNKYGIPFLDILIKRNNDKIWIDIYYKSSNTRCLPFSSYLPNHLKKVYLLYWLLVSAHLLKILKQKLSIWKTLLK